MQILWIKRDIRLVQNYALIRACEGVKTFGPVLPVFVHEPSLWSRAEYSVRHQEFVLECLADYEREIRACGGQLLQLNGEVIESFEALCARHPIKRLVAHEEVTDSPGFARDEGVRRWARERGLPFLEVEQNNVHRGRGARREFAQWFDWAAQAKVRNPSGTDLSAYLCREVESAFTQTPRVVAAGSPCRIRQRGGREQAERCMARFLALKPLLQYRESLSSPLRSVNGCSRLSPYLAWGVISHAELAQRVNETVVTGCQSHPGQCDALQRAARFYLDRLAWRMGYHAHSEVHPDTDSAEYFAAFSKSNKPDAGYQMRLQAMRDGQTGIPWIDASLRQLHATGYLNFRARSTLGNFLCMGLGLHWRDVGDYLASVFLDFDGGAIHWSQCRIMSGTGLLDSLLVYSVTKQGRDWDADCRWVKRWVPELKSLPAHLIHEIWLKPESELADNGVQLGQDYPRALVNPEQASHQGKARVHAIRQGRETGPDSTAQAALF